MIIPEENFKWHLEAFASELFKCRTGLFCPPGMDWMLVVCYWWISCEWRVAPPPSKRIIREEKSCKREGKGKLLWLKITGHMS